MPFQWQNESTKAPELSGASSFAAKGGAPLASLSLWPYRSLPRRGFVWFVGATFALISLPLFAVIGTIVLWGLLPFLLLAVGGMWYFLERSYKDGSILEQLDIWTDKITLCRHNPRGPNNTWEANPYWVSVHLHPKSGPVENYLTLKGNDREVELGAFLTPEERQNLHDQIQHILIQLR